MLKRILFLSTACLITHHSFAMNTGYYVGLQLGHSRVSMDNTTQVVNGSTVTYQRQDTTGPAGRLQYGYMSTPLFGIEMNFTKYATAKSNVTVDNVAAPDASLNAYNLNFLLRFDMHFFAGLDAYVKPGIAWIRADYKESSTQFKFRGDSYFLRPEIALGLSYTFSDSWTGEIEMDHVYGKGHLNSALENENTSAYLPNLNLYTLGVVYSF